jgi:hypothetical protein
MPAKKRGGSGGNGPHPHVYNASPQGAYIPPRFRIANGQQVITATNSIGGVGTVTITNPTNVPQTVTITGNGGNGGGYVGGSGVYSGPSTNIYPYVTQIPTPPTLEPIPEESDDIKRVLIEHGHIQMGDTFDKMVWVINLQRAALLDVLDRLESIEMLQDDDTHLDEP